MTIMLTQWLCALRHAAYAIPWDPARMTPAEVEDAGRAIFGAVLTDHCGICGGPIAPEHARTTFLTMDAALAALAESARQQAATRRVLDALGMTVERLP